MNICPRHRRSFFLMFAALKCIFKRMKTLQTKSHCAQECWWSGTLGFYWCLHSSLTPTSLWNVYREWASKKTVIMLLGSSVSKSMLALCVPNHINYLSGCGSPPLGICCTSLSKHPGSGRAWVLICASTACGGPLWSCSDNILSVSSFAVPFGEAPAAPGRVARTAQNRHKGSFSWAR